MQIDSYAWSGGREAMLRFGPDSGPVAVVALPLFEEANRVRAFTVTLCRLLAKRGVASALPDLPGQGESVVAPETLSLQRVEEAYECAVKGFSKQGRKTYGMAIRSGAVLDKLVLLDGRWHFAPQDGPGLLRELTRIKQAAVGPATQLPPYWYLDPALADGAVCPPVEIAGNRVSGSLLNDLKLYSPWKAEDGRPFRTVRLITDPRPADRHVLGPPLWHRAEPDNDPALAALLCDDIADWIVRCEG